MTGAQKNNKGLSKKTIDNHLILLRRILNVAREWEIIDRVPKHELYRPTNPGFDFLDFEESERLLEAAAKLPSQFSRDQFAVGSGDWGRLIVLALKTGMRIGELLALRWSNVGLRARKLHVCEAVTRKVVGTPKSGRSREMPLTKQAAEALGAQRHLRGEYVFCDLKGAMLTREQCVRPLEHALNEAGMRRITWHILRHSFASHLVMRGVPLKAVQELLGHASLEMTMRYAHLAPAARSHAVACLDEPAPAFDEASDRELSSTLSTPWQRNGKN